MLAKCCGGGGEGSSAVRNTIILGVCLGVSFILLLVAGIVAKNWLPMINLGAVVLVPMAVILSEVLGSGGAGGGASYDEARQAWANLGSCFFGTVLASLFGLPLVLLHVGKLDGVAFALWIVSTVITFGASTWYWISRQRRDAF